MFDFAWSEIAVIGVVALVLIGPKDMPVAIRAVSGVVKKARRMAAEFQTHVDDMLKEADMSEVRDGLRQIRSLDIRGTIARAVDHDGSIRQAFSEPARTPPPVVTTPVEALPEHTIAAPTTEPAPPFIPPQAAPASVAAPAAPAFIPPDAVKTPVAHGVATGAMSEPSV
jgi:sec-independent protein translocase protein TatB